MKTKNIIVALLATVSAGAAIAQEYVVPDAGFVSTRSRADVIAELQQARRDGTLQVLDHEYPKVRLTETRKSRAEVVAEVERARNDGTLLVLDHEYPKATASGPSKTRAQVRAELQEAHANGTARFSQSHYPLVPTSPAL